MNRYNHALITVCIGKEFDRLARLTHPLFQRYAKNIEAEFITINSRVLNHCPVHYEKYQIGRYFNEYERILFVDTDVVIRPNAPNVFERVPVDQFGAYQTSVHCDFHDESIEMIQKEQGDIGWKNHYFNSGVMVLSRSHRSLFDLELGCFNGFGEQTQLNYNVQNLHIPFLDITYRFNHVQVVGEPVSKGTSFLFTTRVRVMVRDRNTNRYIRILGIW